MPIPLLLADLPQEIVPIVAISFGCLVAIISVIMVNTRKQSERKQREESRREIAAYVAEGSMSVEQAEKLMAAGEPPPEKD